MVRIVILVDDYFAEGQSVSEGVGIVQLVLAGCYVVVDFEVCITEFNGLGREARVVAEVEEGLEAGYVGAIEDDVTGGRCCESVGAGGWVEAVTFEDIGCTDFDFKGGFDDEIYLWPEFDELVTVDGGGVVVIGEVTTSSFSESGVEGDSFDGGGVDYDGDGISFDCTGDNRFETSKSFK